MGGDGGQVIDRATMVKTKGWGLTKEAGGRHAASLGEMNSYMQLVSEDRGLSSMQRHEVRMTTCWLSQETLRDPVVVCRLGNLYNKEALIGALLNKSIPEEISHIRALKDVKQCLITWKESEKEGGRRRMVCPVSREDLDAGGSRASVIWPTGALVSPKSLKELKMKECPVTSKPFDPDKDVLPIAPLGEELARLREQLPKSKKRKAAAAVDAGGDKAAAAPSTASKDAAPASSGGPAAAREAKAEGREAKEAAREAKEAKGERAEEAGKSEVYKKLFIKSDGTGKHGTYDALGTPVYNRGSRCI